MLRAARSRSVRESPNSIDIAELALILVKIGNVEMDIPQVGIFYVKNGIACIEFHEPLVNAVSVT